MWPTGASISTVTSVPLRLFAAFATLLCFANPARALTPDQIVLIVNRAEPAGVELAGFYAQARGIPADRILTLDLPTTEEMPFDRYERDVAPAVRKFLRDKGLERSVRCLVTFYGVPLRISNRENGPAQVAELRQMRDTYSRLTAQLEGIVVDVETQAATVDANFKPGNLDQNLEALVRRAAMAGRVIELEAGRSTDPQTRERLAQFLSETTRRLSSPPDPASRPASQPAADLVERLYDPAARQAIRDSAAAGNLLVHARTLQQLIGYLQTEATGSAVDNELALVFWNIYSRVQWQDNPLHLKYAGRAIPHTLMVARLDASTPQRVRDMIANTLATERDGLRGRFAIDARGLAPRDSTRKEDAFGVFDQRLRDLATLVQQKTQTPVVLDNRPEVFPASNRQDDLALYTGWYSLSNFINAFHFNRGAVGYHIASFELVQLHGSMTGHWVRNLLENGVVATLGPVAEPYLHSFPPPDDFFPLLLTGKLTVGEVYWSTTPLTSWMQCFIGDPLYNPFGKVPGLKVEDLPEHLKPALTNRNIQGPAADGR